MRSYAYMSELLNNNTSKHFIGTDGTLTISGSSYNITNYTIIITNDQMNTESFYLRQSLCSTEQIAFGSCEAAEAGFVICENIPTLKGKTLDWYVYLGDDVTTMLKLGTFTVYQDECTADRTDRTVVMYDELTEINQTDVAAWYNTILPSKSSTTTMALFRAGLMTRLGVTVVPATLANDAMTVAKTIEDRTILAGDLLRMICEANGVFGTIDYDGRFKFVALTPGIDDGLFPADNLYPADDLYPQDTNPYVTDVAKEQYYSAEFEDYLSRDITGVLIKTNSEDAGTMVGSDANAYTISNNWLLWGKSAAELQTIGGNILNVIKNCYYKPARVECIGNPCHELGDPIRIKTTYRGVVTYILQRELRGIQSLVDVYESRGTEYCTEQTMSVMSQFKELAGKIVDINIDSDGIKASVSDLAAREQADVSILSSAIAFKVTKTELVNDLDEQMSSGITIEPNRITFGSTGSIVINTANFSLDEDGNAEFSGVLASGVRINAPVISGGRMDGTAVHVSDTDTGGTASLVGDNLTVVAPVGGASSIVQVYGDGISFMGAIGTGFYGPSEARTESIKADILQFNYSLYYGTQRLNFVDVVDANGATRHVLGY